VGLRSVEGEEMEKDKEVEKLRKAAEGFAEAVVEGAGRGGEGEAANVLKGEEPQGADDGAGVRGTEEEG
jgi:hypothetical protein